jgi:putative transposase
VTSVNDGYQYYGNYLGMRYDRPIPGRISYRIPGINYAAPASWFVTICTDQRRCLFGQVIDGIMHRNPLGDIVHQEWMRTSILRPEIELDEFIVMPNHLHVILHLIHGDPALGAHSGAPLRRTPRSLGSIIAGFKSTVSKQINEIRRTPGNTIWQSRYHERMIRTESSLNRIRAYIRNNPMQWHLDRLNPGNHH